MTIPGSVPFASTPYGAVPVIPVAGPEGGPYTVQGPAWVPLLPSAPRTAAAACAQQTNYQWRGLYLWWNVTVNPGGAQTLQLVVQGVEPTTGGVWTVLSTVASTTPGGAVCLYPGLTGGVVESVAVTRNLVLPPVWFATVIPSGVGAWTYSLHGGLLL